MLIQNTSVNNQKITISSLHRRYNNQTISTIEKNKDISDSFVTDVVRDIIMGIPLSVTGIESVEGRITVISGADKILALIRFINDGVVINDDFIEDINNKTFNQLDSLILNRFIEQKITISSFSPDTNVSFFQHFFKRQFSPNEINNILQ